MTSIGSKPDDTGPKKQISHLRIRIRLILVYSLFLIASGCGDTTGTDGDTTGTVPPGRLAAEDALSFLTDHAGDTDLQVVDVRTPAEFAPEHLKGAINIDFTAPHFEERLAILDRGKMCLVYCGSGKRSCQAVEVMERLGFSCVYEIEGGISALKQLGTESLPLELCGCN